MTLVKRFATWVCYLCTQYAEAFASKWSQMSNNNAQGTFWHQNQQNSTITAWVINPWNNLFIKNIRDIKRSAATWRPICVFWILQNRCINWVHNQIDMHDDNKEIICTLLQFLLAVTVWGNGKVILLTSTFCFLTSLRIIWNAARFTTRTQCV